MGATGRKLIVQEMQLVNLDDKEKLYISIDVWTKIPNGGLAIYRCFKILPEQCYCVQSCDFISELIDQEELNNFKAQKIELFLEESPGHRNESCKTLEEAIHRHQSKFSDFFTKNNR